MGLFRFWLKCRTFSSRWRRKAEEEEREKKEKEEAQKVIARWWRERHEARALERHRARAHWNMLIRHVRRDQRVAISWRALADGALEHKKQLEAAPFAWFSGAAKTPKAKPRTADEDELDHGREEWRFLLSTNLDFFYGLRRQFSPRKYIPGEDEYPWPRFPAKKHKALCNLRHPALARRRHPALARRRHPALARRRASMPINDTPINDIELLIRLAALKSNGWQAVNVGGDDNCFFRALAKQVYSDEQEHGRARQETIRYMREHREEFEHFVHDVDLDSYVDNMSIEGTYVEGQFEIQAAANTFNVRIKVYGRSRDHDRTFTPLIDNLETHATYTWLTTKRHSTTSLWSEWIHRRPRVGQAIVLTRSMPLTVDCSSSMRPPRCAHSTRIAFIAFSA
jgi:hypothetical protein